MSDAEAIAINYDDDANDMFCKQWLFATGWMAMSQREILKNIRAAIG